MHVDGVTTSILVELVDAVSDSQIAGDFGGWDGDTLFELANGQIWQQAGPGVATHVAVNPRAVVFSKAGHFELYVEGVDSTVWVMRIK